MDISSCPENWEAKDVSSVEGLLSSSEEHPTSDTVIDFVNTFAETLHIERVDLQQQAFSDVADSFKSPNKGYQTHKEEEKEDAEHQTKSKKGLLSDEEPSLTAYERSFSLPSPRNLVSAMKGGREKQGATPRKLSVSWAPDVYDPTPTSMSHTVGGGGGGGGGGCKKHQKYKNKKNWKNGKKGQKGSSSRGGSSKDKKQSRTKVSNGSYRSMDTREALTEPGDEFNDLTIGSLDSQSYCGTSFLKNSLASMHYPVAEAS